MVTLWQVFLILAFIVSAEGNFLKRTLELKIFHKFVPWVFFLLHYLIKLIKNIQFKKNKTYCKIAVHELLHKIISVFKYLTKIKILSPKSLSPL